MGYSDERDMSRSKQCKVCGGTFFKRKVNSLASWMAAKFCSRQCSANAWSANSKISDEEMWNRMLKKTEVDQRTGCINWTGATNGRYGITCVRGKHAYAHRASLEIKLGRKIKTGLFSCHTCDNPKCVNPEHLYEGTQEENMSDAVLRGHVWWRKLTPENVREIRRSSATTAQLARDYGVSQQSIKKVRDFKTWKHVK